MPMQPKKKSIHAWFCCMCGIYYQGIRITPIYCDTIPSRRDCDNKFCGKCALNNICMLCGDTLCLKCTENSECSYYDE
jgi:hypothetical protein